MKSLGQVSGSSLWVKSLGQVSGSSLRVKSLGQVSGSSVQVMSPGQVSRAKSPGKVCKKGSLQVSLLVKSLGEVSVVSQVLAPGLVHCGLYVAL